MAKQTVKHPNRLAAVMAEKGLNLTALVKKTKLGQGTVSDLKNQKTGFSIPSLTACAKALGVPQGVLLVDGEGLGKDTGGGVTMLTFNDLHPNPDNPRTDTDPFRMNSLAESIQEQGILVPLLVEPADANGRYRIIDGGRRYMAVRKIMAATKKFGDFPIPVAIRQVDAKKGKGKNKGEDYQRLLMALTGNTSEPMNPVDEGRAFLKLKNDFKMLPKTVGKVIGRTERHVEGRIALVRDLSAAVLAALKEDGILIAQARGLRTTKDKELQDLTLARIVAGDEGLQTFHQIKDHLTPPQPDDAQTDLEDVLSGEGEEDKKQGKLTINEHGVITDGYQSMVFSRNEVDAGIKYAEIKRGKWIAAGSVNFKIGSMGGHNAPLSTGKGSPQWGTKAEAVAAEAGIIRGFCEGAITSTSSMVTPKQRKAALEVAMWCSGIIGDDADYAPPAPPEESKKKDGKKKGGKDGAGDGGLYGADFSIRQLEAHMKGMIKSESQCDSVALARFFDAYERLRETERRSLGHLEILLERLGDGRPEVSQSQMEEWAEEIRSLLNDAEEPF